MNLWLIRTPAGKRKVLDIKGDGTHTVSMGGVYRSKDRKLLGEIIRRATCNDQKPKEKLK